MAEKTVTVRVVPLSGDATEHTVPYTKGMTVAQAMTSAGVAPQGKDVSVETAAGATLKPGDSVMVTDKRKVVKAGQQVTVRERPQGS